MTFLLEWFVMNNTILTFIEKWMQSLFKKIQNKEKTLNFKKKYSKTYKNSPNTSKAINIKEKLKIITCDVKAGDEQNPLSLDSPGLRRIAGEYYTIK